jgi:hypothetical protein
VAAAHAVAARVRWATMGSRRYAIVSGTLFAAISLLQLLRALNAWPAHVGGWPVPIWLSWAAFVVTGGLAAWAFRVARQ